MPSLAQLWPLMGLRITTDRLELRLPSEAELAQLAALGAAEPYDPSVPMFAGRGDTSARRVWRFLQHYWKAQGCWDRTDWSLDLVAFENGQPVGSQNVRARSFAVLREVETGSWIQHGRRGEGLGTHMRAAALHLAFEGLRADHALSGAREDNEPSLRVSRKFGYLENGIERHAVDGEVLRMRRMRLPAARWREQTVGIEVRLDGLDDCYPLFGIEPPSRS